MLLCKSCLGGPTAFQKLPRKTSVDLFSPQKFIKLSSKSFSFSLLGWHQPCFIGLESFSDPLAARIVYENVTAKKPENHRRLT